MKLPPEDSQGKGLGRSRSLLKGCDSPQLILALVFAALIVGGFARAEISQPDTKAAQVQMQERRKAIEDFKTALDEATTVEQKRAVIENWRKQNEALRQQRQAAMPEQKSPRKMLQEMKAKAQGNPAMQERVAKLENRIVEMEQMKAQLEAIRTAQGDQKRELLAKFQKERQVMAEARRKELETRQISKPELNRPLPPEVQARMAQVEEREKQVEVLREALKSRDPAQRQKALEEFRANNEKLRQQMEVERGRRMPAPKNQGASQP